MTLKTETAIQLGDRVRCRITKVEGIVVVIANWLNGCRRIGIQQETLDKDKKVPDHLHFDEEQLEVVKRNVVPPKVPATPAMQPQAVRKVGTGGPAREGKGFTR